MHRFSESIGAIAAALAKAQTELNNPEKSLVGIIGPTTPRGTDRTFRYAPLSSGLDIARKCLGRQSIAIVQTTAIDKDVGVVRLCTSLVHASGEWVSSEWPVCRLGDFASPQRMGAALTYARRYALFTLVGIAGEDDLDAPDLLPTTMTELDQPITASGRDEQKPYLKRLHEKGLASTSTTLLDADASAVLRDKMIAELEAITTEDEAVGWAHGGLLAKNNLVLADADAVEQAFRFKMQSVGRNDNEPISVSFDNGDHSNLKNSEASSTSGQRTSSLGDMPTAMPVAMPSRKRDKLHRAFVCSCPCVICGRSPSDAHHTRFAQPRALGHKVSDEFTIPLCRVHHRDLHRRGDEKNWWDAYKIEPMEIARKLWLESHGKRLNEAR